jgi:hypothetical protein
MDDKGACAAPLFLSDSLNLAPSFNVGFTPALTPTSADLEALRNPYSRFDECKESAYWFHVNAKHPTGEPRTRTEFLSEESWKAAEWGGVGVIPPLLTRVRSRDYATAMSRCFCVMPPRPMLGRS